MCFERTGKWLRQGADLRRAVQQTADARHSSAIDRRASRTMRRQQRRELARSAVWAYLEAAVGETGQLLGQLALRLRYS